MTPRRTKSALFGEDEPQLGLFDAPARDETAAADESRKALGFPRGAQS